MDAPVRAWTLLLLTGASAALFVQELVGKWLLAFVTQNTMSIEDRRRLIVGMVVGAGVAGGAGLVAWVRGARVQRIAHLCAPGILLAFVPPLCLTSAWTNQVRLTLVLAGFLLVAERLFRLALGAAAEGPALPSAFGGDDKPPRFPAVLRRFGAGLRERFSGAGVGLFPGRTRQWLPAALVGAGVLGYAIYMSTFTLFMHGRFQTYGFDLGQYDNVFWSTLHGNPLRDTPLGLDKNWEELRGHADLATFFFLPFYALRPAASTLLIIQSCVLALGAIPLYRFAARRLPRSYAAVIAFAYLFYPPTHGFQFYDFHFQPIAALFVLLVIDFVDERRYWACGVAFTIGLACREDISVGLAILGTFLALSGYRIRAGLIMAAVATLYFIVIRFIIMPSFGSWGFHDVYKQLLPQGAQNFGGIIATMLSNPLYTLVTLLTPEKLRYALQILLPLAFLPIRRTYLVASIVPGSIFTLLTTEYAPTIDLGFQYSGHFLPYVFPAAAIAIASFGAEGEGLVRRRAALAALVTGTVLCGVYWGAIPPRDVIHGGFGMLPMTKPTVADRQKHRDMVELHALIPHGASVAISEAEMPHVSRDVIRTLRDGYDADYILYGIHSGYAGAHNAQKALASGDFEKIAERPGLALLRRKPKAPPVAPPAPTPPADVPRPAPAPLPPPPPLKVAPAPASRSPAPPSGPDRRPGGQGPRR